MSNNFKSLISIITVSYNAAETIEQTILSVINQNYENIEFIIIDGNSTDGTVDVIEKYGDKIKYWISEPDKGIYDAMNKGWSIANDESYILYLGAGDKIINLPDLNLYSKNEVIYGNVALGEKNVFKGSIGWRTFLGNTIHHQAMLIHKSIHIPPPFSLDFNVYSDFNQRLLKQGVRFVKDELFNSYALEGGVSADIDINEVTSVVRKNHGFLFGILSALYLNLQRFNENRKNNSSNSTL